MHDGCAGPLVQQVNCVVVQPTSKSSKLGHLHVVCVGPVHQKSLLALLNLARSASGVLLVKQVNGASKASKVFVGPLDLHQNPCLPA